MEHAADVARYLVGFEAYRGSRARAEAALKRRAAGFSQEEHQRALDEAIAMFRAAEKIVAKAVSSARYGGEKHDLRPCVARLERDHPGFPAQTYDWVVNWLHLYYHLM